MASYNEQLTSTVAVSKQEYARLVQEATAYRTMIAKVFELPDEFTDIRNASGQDILKSLGSQSREEYEYYKSL